MAYFNLHKMQKLIFQLNLIVGNSLDESIKVDLHRPQHSLIVQLSANEKLSACGRQELQVRSVSVVNV